MRGVVEKAAVGLLILFLLGACAPKAAPSPSTSIPLPQVPAPQTTPLSKEKGGDLLEKLVKVAQAEGRVVVYGGLGGLTRRGLGERFKERFGMPVEFITGRGAEVTEKLAAERRGGLYLADVYISGSTGMVTRLIPRGHLDPLDGVIVDPDVLDGKNWFRGGLDWIDKEHKALAFLAYANSPLGINTNVVKPGEIKSYRDLLNPRWKGKIVMADPTITGSGSKTMGVIAGVIMGWDFARELIKQEPMITRDLRLQMDWLAHGKYPIAIAPDTIVMTEFREVGAPVAYLTPQEGSYLSSGYGNLGLVNRAPHPSAARLFINWLLTKEGQTIFSRTMGAQSGRLDVPTDHLPKEYLREPGVNYLISYSEEYVLKEPEVIEKAAEVFKPLLSK